MNERAKSFVKWTVPTNVVVGLQRVQRARRAGLPTPYPRAFSPRWNRWMDRSTLDCLPPGSVDRSACAIDVGAHVGAWSEAALQILQPRRLVAFEPSPDSFLQLNARLGGRPGVELRQQAVGDRHGVVELLQSDRSDFNSVLGLRVETSEHYRGGVGITGSVPVPMVPLDDALGDIGPISVLKIDVQGLELAVIVGAENVLARARVVLLETNFVSHYEGDALFCDLDAAMRDRGFRLHRFGYQSHDADGRLLWADAVYSAT